MTDVLSRPTAYSPLSRGYLTPHVLKVCRLYVDGYTMDEAATMLGCSLTSSRDAVKRCRIVLAARGYRVSNAISLRKAMRAEGLIDDLERI